jgi:hypothetical protein
MKPDKQQQDGGTHSSRSTHSLTIQGEDKNDDDDDDDKEETIRHKIPPPQIQPKTKAKREAKILQHRHHPTPTVSSTAQSTQSSSLANPMSRFLTAFSVQPVHWDHKRRIAATTTTTTTTTTASSNSTINNEKDPDEPLEKRFRPSTQDNEDTDDDGDMFTKNRSGKRSSTTITTVMATVAVSVLAIAVVAAVTKSLYLGSRGQASSRGGGSGGGSSSSSKK